MNLAFPLATLLRLLMLIMGSALLIHPVVATPTIPTAEEVGTTPGELNVSGGNAQYMIPIKVAPGRGGMQPEVSLVYNSAAGNVMITGCQNTYKK